ncbi:TPA: Rha family transcriptional regulator, partial [Escherichia coli]
MNIAIFNGKVSMTSVEIAELVGKRHDNVKRTIETLAKGGVVRSPQIEVSERINNLGFKVQYEHYLFEGEQGKRDSIIVVAQLCPEFTARLVDRWRELEEQIRKPMSEIEMVAAMALEAVRQQKRITQVEEKVSHVAETVEQIKKGTIREGYAGYRQLKAKTGLSDDKCRNLVNAYQIPTDTHEFMTPDGLLSRR